MEDYNLNLQFVAKANLHSYVSFFLECLVRSYQEHKNNNKINIKTKEENKAQEII